MVEDERAMNDGLKKLQKLIKENRVIQLLFARKGVEIVARR